MSLKEKIIEELNDAIKEKKDLEVLVLRQLKAAILNKEKEKKLELEGTIGRLKKNLEDLK